MTCPPRLSVFVKHGISLNMRVLIVHVADDGDDDEQHEEDEDIDDESEEDNEEQDRQAPKLTRSGCATRKFFLFSVLHLALLVSSSLSDPSWFRRSCWNVALQYG